MVDKGHIATLGLFLDRVAGSALGADKQNSAAVGRERSDEIHRIVEQRQGFFQVDDVDLVAVAEDVGTHLGVPVPGLMSEMDTGFQHLPHGHLAHVDSSSIVSGLNLHASQGTTCSAGTRHPVTIRVWR